MKATRFGDYERVVKFPVFADYKIHVVVTDDLQKSWNARCEEEYDAADIVLERPFPINELEELAEIVFDSPPTIIDSGEFTSIKFSFPPTIAA